MDEALIRHEVRGREAELAAALVAMGDLALDDERTAEHARRLLHVTGRDERSDLRRRHGLTVDLDQRRDACLELGARAQHVDVAGRLLAEVEVLAHRHLYRLKLPDQYFLDELLGRLRAEVLVERDHNELLDAKAGDDVAL